jgi:SAM-dependent methyltransferase
MPEAKQQLKSTRQAFIRNLELLVRNHQAAFRTFRMKTCESGVTRLRSDVSPSRCENQKRLKATASVTKLTQKSSGKLNLDAGCGDGRYAAYFSLDVIGLDLDLESLKISKGKYDDVLLGSVCYLPFKQRAFDCVLCCEVIEHIPKSEAEKALKELERVSNLLLITTPNRNKWFQTLARLVYGPENPQHVSLWSVKELREKHFAVYGCLGWVTAERVPTIFQKLWNLLAWYFPEAMGGDLIATKSIFECRRRNKSISRNLTNFLVSHDTNSGR